MKASTSVKTDNYTIVLQKKAEIELSYIKGRQPNIRDLTQGFGNLAFRTDKHHVGLSVFSIEVFNSLSRKIGFCNDQRPHTQNANSGCQLNCKPFLNFQWWNLSPLSEVDDVALSHVPDSDSFRVCGFLKKYCRPIGMHGQVNFEEESTCSVGT